MISILWNLLECVLLSILVTIPFELEMNVYSLLLDEVFCKCPLDIANWWCWSVHLCPDWFPTCWISQQGLIEGFKSPIMLVDLSVSPYNSISFCFTYFDSLLLRYIHVKDCYFFSENWTLYIYVLSLLIPSKFLAPKQFLSEINSYIFFWWVIWGYIFLHLFTFNISVFTFKVGFL